MAKIFPIIRRIISAGGQGLGLDMGSQTESMAFSVAQTRDLGSQTESMGHTEVITLPQGTQTESVVASATGSATYPQGSQTEAMAFSATQVRELGTQSESFAASAIANLSQYTTTGTAVTPDAPAWNNPTNAQGNFDATNAVHPGVSGIDLAFDATLRCSGLVVPSTPSGFTRIGAIIRIRHAWDIDVALPVAGVKDMTQQIDLRDSADAFIANLITRRASSHGNQTALTTEEYNIQALVSDAQLAAGVKVDCRTFSTGVLVFATDGTFWNVDGVHLVASYSRTGIT